MDEANDFKYLDVEDYVVFGILLAISALIGVYFAYFAPKKQNTTSEYLLGGKSMGVFPISMSLIASYTSGIALLGYPSEMYVFGAMLLVSIFSEFVVSIVMSTVYIPVFYKLQITSSYEYLNKRFGRSARTLGSVLFITKMMLYIPIVIYTPALAFSQVTGFSLNLLIPTVCVVCIFYTTLGGIKAVVWTDTLQMFLMVMGVVAVTIIGNIDVGGMGNVYDRNLDSGRMEFFNMSWDPTIRHTFWNITIGRFFHHLASCTINQAMVQRCLALPSLKKAQISTYDIPTHQTTMTLGSPNLGNVVNVNLMANPFRLTTGNEANKRPTKKKTNTVAIFAIGILGFTLLCCYMGLLSYAAFFDCDPVSVGIVNKADQILPYFVMKVTSHVPVLPGIFLSGVFSASLSTMSTGLNSMCGVIAEDFIKPMTKKPLSEAQISFYMKVTTVALGCACTLMAFVVGQLTGVIQASVSLGGITGGTLLGMFTLGMLCPWANEVGALVGGVSAAVLVGSMSIGSQIAIHNKQLVFPKKPVSIIGCDNATLHRYWSSQTETLPLDVSREAPIWLFTVSYSYYAVIGTLTVLIVGMIVSWLFGTNEPHDMDPDVFSPVIKRFLLPKKRRTHEMVTF